jgi:hypothetical protein
MKLDRAVVDLGMPFKAVVKNISGDGKIYIGPVDQWQRAKLLSKHSLWMQPFNWVRDAPPNDWC